MSTRPTTGDTSQTSPDELPAIHRTALQTGTVLAGRYRVERLIGEGGMGDVYLATHLKIDKPVAIKILAPEQMRRAKTVSRFLQEAKAASKIRHPNVVDITDFGEADGCAFLVMEFLEGEDLDALLKRERTLPWPRAKRICVALLQALSAAHAAGIFHRDIKPHNCFVTPRPSDPDFVKIIDFGIAKLRVEGSEEQLTRTGAIMGTAEYMSPEQGLGAEVDGRTDLYSVGIILYRMLTGNVPFLGNNPMAVLYQHIHTAWVPPSQASPAAQWSRQIGAVAIVGALAVGGWWLSRPSAPVLDPENPDSPQTAAMTETETRPPTQPVASTPVVVPSPAADPATPADARPPVVVPPSEPAPVARPVPAHRSDKTIETALGKIAGDVRACAKKAGLFPGERVRVSLDIAPPGQIAEAVVHGAFSAAGQSCIEKAVRQARFGRAGKPQRYEHTFEL